MVLENIEEVDDFTTSPLKLHNNRVAPTNLPFSPKNQDASNKNYHNQFLDNKIQASDFRKADEIKRALEESERLKNIGFKPLKFNNLPTQPNSSLIENLPI